MLKYKDLHKTYLTVGEFYIMFENRGNISLFMPHYPGYHGNWQIRKMIFIVKIRYTIMITNTFALIFKHGKIIFFFV